VNTAPAMADVIPIRPERGPRLPCGDDWKRAVIAALKSAGQTRFWLAQSVGCEPSAISQLLGGVKHGVESSIVRQSALVEPISLLLGLPTPRYTDPAVPSDPSLLPCGDDWKIAAIDRLSEIGKTRQWLAEQVGADPASITILFGSTHGGVKSSTARHSRLVAPIAAVLGIDCPRYVTGAVLSPLVAKIQRLGAEDAAAVEVMVDALLRRRA
jgi:hypothetical protein